MTAHDWFVVRASHKIPGGLRIVQVGLTEEAAKRLAASYKRPHQAMPRSEVVANRLAALKEMEDNLDS